ncbi:MAG: PrgI family protein [Candidatus Saccharibacteria bacterium]|nr:PrgI family protein [Candidatus Saccharibacteria bacterium]
MAQYKVPQDVEADDKLLGPFSFRQFIYLLIAAALIAVAVLLFRVFPLLVILPLPFVLFLLALALPLKKDQPMETYLSAVISYYMKPHNRIWEPGEPESTIVITAPKKTDEIHLKDLNQDEAMHRLSFLADIVDTEGYAIKGGSTNGIREDVIAEANATKDIFETQYAAFSQQNFQQTVDTHHAELVNQMRDAIAKNSAQVSQNTTISHTISTGPTPPKVDYNDVIAAAEPAAPVTPVTPLPQYPQPTPVAQTAPNLSPPNFVTNAMQAAPVAVGVATATPTTGPTLESIQAELNNLPPLPGTTPDPSTGASLTTEQNTNPLAEESVSANDNIIKPDLPLPDDVVEQIAEEEKPSTEYIPADVAARLGKDDEEDTGRVDQTSQTTPSQDIIDLANNSDFSIETIAQQAKRINDKQDNEVYVSLH